MRVFVFTVAIAMALGANAQNTELSGVDGYSGTGCRNYDATWVTLAGTNDSEDGQCFAFPKKGYPSIMVSQLAASRGCTVTVYSDEDCTNRATNAQLDICVSGGPWLSFSTDGCKKS